MFGWKCPKQNSNHVFWGYCGAWRFVPWGTYVITQNSPCHADTHIHIPNEISIPAAHNIDHIHHVSHKISIISIQHGIQRQRYIGMWWRCRYYNQHFESTTLLKKDSNLHHKKCGLKCLCWNYHCMWKYIHSMKVNTDNAALLKI